MFDLFNSQSIKRRLNVFLKLWGSKKDIHDSTYGRGGGDWLTVGIPRVICVFMFRWKQSWSIYERLTNSRKHGLQCTVVSRTPTTLTRRLRAVYWQSRPQVRVTCRFVFSYNHHSIPKRILIFIADCRWHNYRSPRAKNNETKQKTFFMAKCCRMEQKRHQHATKNSTANHDPRLHNREALPARIDSPNHRSR